ncbi:MAG: GTPase Era [Treponema sp.]|jgi:GTP-binding protein Era|nr:GTPase Era [Treponema sp.]
MENKNQIENQSEPENSGIGEKTALVAILGRPSAGKSTFINTACQEPVSIVSPIPQTTRNAIRGIVNTSLGQLVFVDTPGYHDSEKKLNLRLKSVTEETLEGSDCILYVIDTTREPGEEEKMNATLASKYVEHLVVALNKIDANDSKVKKSREFVKLYLPGLPEERILEMSAKNDTGINEVLRALYSVSPVAPALYTEDVYTDQDIAFRISEIVRGEAINRLQQELPHCLYVSVADLEQRGNNGKIWVRAFICVERDSQKGMVIGKGAGMIKQIRMASIKKIHEVFPFKVDLDLQVKVDKNWRQHDNTITKLIPE